MRPKTRFHTLIRNAEDRGICCTKPRDFAYSTRVIAFNKLPILKSRAAAYFHAVKSHDLRDS